MAESRNGVIDIAIKVLAVIEEVAKDEVKLHELVLTTGWEFDDLIGFKLTDISDALAPLSADLETLLTYVDKKPASFEEAKYALDKARSAFGRLKELKSALVNIDLQGPDKERLLDFSKDLLNLLVTIYIKTESPVLFNILHLLTLVDFDNDDLKSIAQANGKVIRHPSLFPRLKLDRTSDIFSDPAKYFKQYYLPNGLRNDGDAIMAAHKIFPRIQNILHDLKINTQLGFSNQHGVDFGPESNALANSMLSIFFEPTEGIDFGLNMSLSPVNRGNLGLVLIPFGNLDFSKKFTEWQFHFTLTAGTQGIALGPEGATLLGGASGTDVELKLKIEKIAPDDTQPAFLLGGKDGSRLEIGELFFDSSIGLKDSEFDIGLLLQANKGKFALMPGDGDGLLAKVLPQKGLQLDFDLGLGWSKKSGMYLKGSAGLETQLNIHQSVLGILDIETILLKLALADGGIQFTAASSLKLKLGPITCIINEVGIQNTLDFVGEGGNVGIADTRISFKPPSGAGITVDAGGIKGGGILNFNPDTEEYFGALELEFKNLFSLKAFGIINTRMPDGTKGFSFLIIVTAEFTPIQLGFGFTLNGVGGLLGVNRTTRVDVLKEGIKNNTLKSILFPDNVVANINRIVSDIKQVFPPQADHYLICPMGKIGWGTPTLITLELGILIEIPATGFKILGVLKALLPNENNPLLRMQVNFLGIIDFDNRSISFDASLYDSKILTFTLTGDMAFRLSFGDNPLFLLSVGGFHPAFKEVPADLKNMRRITLSLYDGANARITIQTYFAITSNTAQVGAKAELFAGSEGGFNIYGFVNYDVLFQFSPFQFIADLNAGVALRRGKSVIMSIQVDGELSGPTPWEAHGKASVSFFFFSVSVPFNVKWGDENQITDEDKADLKDLLAKEINDNRNWHAEIPVNNKLHVSIRQIPASDLLPVHPFGILTFSERLLPLELNIDKFGTRLPSAEKNLTIKVGTNNLKTDTVQEQFAPANFFKMSDAEKLSRPSFERMTSGFKISGSSQIIAPKNVATKPVDYEFSYLGKPKKPGRTKYQYPGRFFKAHSKSGAVAQSSLSHVKNRVSLNAPEAVAVDDDEFVVANVADLKLFNKELKTGTYSEMVEQINAIVNKTPELKGRVQVVSKFEANFS